MAVWRRKRPRSDLVAQQIHSDRPVYLQRRMLPGLFPSGSLTGVFKSRTMVRSSTLNTRHQRVLFSFFITSTQIHSSDSSDCQCSRSAPVTFVRWADNLSFGWTSPRKKNVIERNPVLSSLLTRVFSCLESSLLPLGIKGVTRSPSFTGCEASLSGYTDCQP